MERAESVQGESQDISHRLPTSLQTRRARRDTVSPDVPLRQRHALHTRQDLADRECALVAALSADSTHDFRVIYTLTAGPFAAIVRGIIWDNALVQDVLQKAYLSIWSSRRTFDADRGSAFGWMLTIVRNKAIDELRVRSRREREVGLTEAMIATLACPSPPVDAHAALADVRHKLERVIAQLDDNRAFAIREVVCKGRSAVDVAKQIGRSDNTVKSWVRRGLRNMRDEFGDDQFTDWL